VDVRSWVGSGQNAPHRFSQEVRSHFLSHRRHRNALRTPWFFQPGLDVAALHRLPEARVNHLLATIDAFLPGGRASTLKIAGYRHQIPVKTKHHIWATNSGGANFISVYNLNCRLQNGPAAAAHSTGRRLLAFLLRCTETTDRWFDFLDG
jgi:hypothetical protein